MKVVHIVTAWPRGSEDPITPWLVELVRRQRESGIEASVLAPAYRGGPAGPSSGSGVPVRRFRYAPARWERLTHDETVPDRLRREPRYLALLPLYLAAGVAAAAAAGRGVPDVAHVHWPVPHAVLGAAMRLGSGGRTALVCSYYSVELTWVGRRLPWLRPFARWTVRTADGVTAISRSTAALVRDLAGREAAVIPYGAALVDDGAPPARPALAGGGPLRLLFVGRLVERKGVETLVRALGRLSAHREARLTVIGEGEREAEIRRVTIELGLGDRVELTGRVSGAELARRYQEADIFVLPAVVDSKGDTEGLGVVLLEALRFERPVIASAVGGIPDIVEPGRSGWLVPPGDPEALAAAVERAASEPERARAVAREGRRLASERFGWERISDSTRQAYEEAVRARRAGPVRERLVSGRDGGAPPADRYQAWLRSERYLAERSAKAGVVARLCRPQLETARRIADLGAGTGLIKKALEKEFHKPIVGFELDMPFIRERTRVARADVLRLPVADGALDFVIANHLYEHVADPAALFREMWRVLRPGGWAYVSAGSRLAVVEPHYRLPFLTWLPAGAAGAYVRLAGRGGGYEGIRFLTYRPLAGMMRGAGFRVVDETERAIDEMIGERWGRGWARAWGLARRLPGRWRGALLRLFCPQWFFLLEKPAARRRAAPGPAGTPRG